MVVSQWLSDPLGAAALARKRGGRLVNVALGIYEYAALSIANRDGFMIRCIHCFTPGCRMFGDEESWVAKNDEIMPLTRRG